MLNFQTQNIDPNLVKCFEFIFETGKLKSVLRQNHMPQQNRRENSAEHSWHVILMALSMKDYANEPIDINKVIKMMAVHDLGEIDSGDEFHYTKNSKKDDQERECIKRLCDIAPQSLADEVLNLWQEFEERQTPEAKFAHAIDRFHPFLYQLENGGEAWKRHKISHEKALEKNEHIKDGSEVLWKVYQDLALQAKESGCFHE